MAQTKSLDLENSSSQHAAIADASQTGLDTGSGDMTLEISFKPESHVDQNLMGKWNSAGNQRSFIWQYSASTGLYFAVSSNGSSATDGSVAVTLASNRWYRLAVAYDASAGTAEMYVNGVSIGTISSLATSIFDSTAPFEIGHFTSSGTYCDGKLKDARFWNDLRTDQEILDNYDVVLTGAESGLVSLWLLENDYTDSAGSNDLTASGAPSFVSDVPFFPADFGSTAKITIDNTKVVGSGNFTDIPILFADDNFIADIYANTQSAGQDLRFTTDLEGRVLIPHEIVDWDTVAEEAEVWVKIPTLDYNDDTVIYVWYNNATVPAVLSTDYYGSKNVWPTEFKAVYHLNTDFSDSTVNANTMTGSNSPTFAAGKIKSGADFELSSSQSASIADGSQTGLDITGDLTILAWSKFESRSNARQGLVSKWDDAQRAYGLSVTPTNIQLHINNGTEFEPSNALSTTNGVWTHLGVTYDTGTTTGKFFQDGSQLGTDKTGGIASISNTSASFRLSYITEAWYNDGMLDEVWVTADEKSEDFVATVYNNQSDPSTFATGSAISNSAIKTINGLAKASVKVVNTLAIASVKTWNGLA